MLAQSLDLGEGFLPLYPGMVIRGRSIYAVLGCNQSPCVRQGCLEDANSSLASSILDFKVVCSMFKDSSLAWDCSKNSSAILPGLKV